MTDFNIVTYIVITFSVLLVVTKCMCMIYSDNKKRIAECKDKLSEDWSYIERIMNDMDHVREFLDRVDQEIFDTIDIVMEPIDPIIFHKLPEKGSSYAAGYDLYWSTVNKDLNEDGSVTINPGETLIFGTNLKIMITIDNFYLDICSRSGLSINKNLVVVNSPARIDSDYRGELLIGLKNISDTPAVIEPRSRIAQCTLHREVSTNFFLGTVVNNSERGEGGLGHSG